MTETCSWCKKQFKTKKDRKNHNCTGASIQYFEVLGKKDDTNIH